MRGKREKKRKEGRGTSKGIVPRPKGRGKKNTHFRCRRALKRKGENRRWLSCCHKRGGKVGNIRPRRRKGEKGDGVFLNLTKKKRENLFHAKGEKKKKTHLPSEVPRKPNALVVQEGGRGGGKNGGGGGSAVDRSQRLLESGEGEEKEEGEGKRRAWPWLVQREGKGDEGSEIARTKKEGKKSMHARPSKGGTRAQIKPVKSIEIGRGPQGKEKKIESCVGPPPRKRPGGEGKGGGG